jgi:tRNA1Val (adenine37-N6)-methyltransferase
MANTYFSFKQFTIHQDACAMKVTTDAALFGAWCAAEIATHHSLKQKLLDIGTGTGLLSLMVAQQADVTIDAVEIDKNAALQAAKNVRESPYAGRIIVTEKDINSFKGTGYDVIVSNPPFYEGELEGPRAQKNTAHHGRSLNWETLFSLIGKKLTAGGCFFLLLPFKRKNEIGPLFEQNRLFAHKLVFVKQTTAHAPFRIMLSGSFARAETNTYEIAIRDEANTYTPEFVELLQPFYLYL